MFLTQPGFETTRFSDLVVWWLPGEHRAICVAVLPTRTKTKKIHHSFVNHDLLRGFESKCVQEAWGIGKIAKIKRKITKSPYSQTIPYVMSKGRQRKFSTRSYGFESKATIFRYICVEPICNALPSRRSDLFTKSRLGSFTWWWPDIQDRAAQIKYLQTSVVGPDQSDYKASITTLQSNFFLEFG